MHKITIASLALGFLLGLRPPEPPGWDGTIPKDGLVYSVVGEHRHQTPAGGYCTWTIVTYPVEAWAQRHAELAQKELETRHFGEVPVYSFLGGCNRPATFHFRVEPRPVGDGLGISVSEDADHIVRFR